MTWVCGVCKKKTKHAICFIDRGNIEYSLCGPCYGKVTEGEVKLKANP